MSKATGGMRLARLLPKIHRGGVWVDTYNQCVSDIAGTITSRIEDYNHFVSDDYQPTDGACPEQTDGIPGIFASRDSTDSNNIRGATTLP